MKRLLGAAAVATVVLGLALVAPSLYSRSTFLSGPAPMLLTAWGLFALFALSAVSIGSVVVRWAHRGARPDGFWGLSLATGIGIFALCNGFFAWFHLIGPRYFVLMPLVLLAIGLPAVMAELSVWQPRRLDLSLFEVLAVAFAAVCLLVLGLQTVNPDNANFDATWYHLRAGERYALAGGMVRTPEGDLLLTLPQTASWLYCWAFCWPSVIVDDRIRLALLIELGTVLATLATIPALIRALCPTLPARTTRLGWVAFFFFPSIFIYDTGIMGGADHVVALWSVTSLITWFQARRSVQRGPWVLFGLNVACLLAKYSSLYVLVPLVLVVGIDWLSRFKRSRSYGPLLAAVVAVCLTSPYWLRNTLWYNNPIYPAASHVFHNDPWNADADAWNLAQAESTGWAENGSLSHRLTTTLKALYDYQTELYTYATVTGGQPIAGPAYFLSLLALPFISTRKRLLLLAFIVHAGIAIWHNTHQYQIRYLTVLFAPMAAATAAVALSLWREGWLFGKAAVLTVIGFLLAAYGDAPFRKTHITTNNLSVIDVAGDYFARHGTRSGRYAAWETLGAALPPNAVPLVHAPEGILGLGRQSVTDVTQLQFGINYARLGSIREIARHLRTMGVTHLVLSRSVETNGSLGGEALFQGLALQITDKKNVSGFTVGELPEAPKELGNDLLYLGCNHVLENGLYTLESVGFPLPPWYHPFPQPALVAVAVGDGRALMARASYVAIENNCQQADPPGGEFAFGIEMNQWPRQRLRFFVRSSGVAAP